MKRLFLTLFLVFGLVMSAQAAYPDRPVTIVVPFNAGGSMDSMVRIVAEYMRQELGKPVMVSNRPGASGTIGINAYFKMRPDGYNVLAFPTSAFVAPVFQGREAIDTSKLVPVGGFQRGERILFARPDAPFKTFKELVAYAKANPGKLKFGSGGDTATAYVFRSILQKEKLDVNVTLFNGGAPAAAAIMGGHVDLIEGGNGSPADVAATAGKLSRLCLLSSGSLANHPELKNPLQMGYDYASGMIFSLFVLKDTPADVRQALSHALQKILKDPGLQKKFASRGLIPAYYTPEEVEDSTKSLDHIGQLYDELGKL